MNDFEESGVGQGTLNELQQVSYPPSSACDIAWRYVSGRGKERRHILSVSVAKRGLCDNTMVTTLLSSRSQLAMLLGGESRQMQAGQLRGLRNERCCLSLRISYTRTVQPHSPTSSRLRLTRRSLVCSGHVPLLYNGCWSSSANRWPY